MAITISFTKTSDGTAADSVINGIVTVTNAGANTISVQGVSIVEQSTLGANIRQPDFLTSNAAPGTFPTIAAGASASYPWSVVCAVPNTPGASPNAPNAYHGPMASPPADTVCRLSLFVQAYDSVAAAAVNNTAALQFPLSPAVAQFPVPQGGALQFNSGGDAVNWFFF